MIGIYCRLVPAVDDGSRSPEETHQLIETMRSIGIRRIIITPYTCKRYPHSDSNTLRQKLEQLLPRLSDMRIPLMLGAGYMLDEDFETHLDKPLLTLGDSKYLLVETLFTGTPLDLYRPAQSVVVSGAIPMLVHPERHLYMDDKTYDHLRGAGCVFQLNLFSLAGMYGEQVQRRAQQLLECGVCSFADTDTHRVELFRGTISPAKTYARYEDTIRTLIENNGTLIATHM